MARALLRADQMRDEDVLEETEHDVLVHENLVTSGTLNFQDGTISGTGDVYATTYYGDGSELTGVSGGGSSNPESLYYNGTDVRATATAAGISITDGTATAATIGFTDDDLHIVNNDPDGHIILTARNTGDTLDNVLFDGDPDGAVELYYAGVLTAKTGAAKFQIFSADDILEISNAGVHSYITNWRVGGWVHIRGSNTGAYMFRGNPTADVELRYNNVRVFNTTAAGISITDGTATAATIGFTDDDLDIRNSDPDGHVRIYGTSDQSHDHLFFDGDPDGQVALYYDGIKFVGMVRSGTDLGLSLYDLTDTGKVTHLQQGDNGYFSVYNETNAGYIRFYGSSSDVKKILYEIKPGATTAHTFYSKDGKQLDIVQGGLSIYNNGTSEQKVGNVANICTWAGFVHGRAMRIQADNAATGATKTLFYGDPDGAAELYYAGAKVFETLADGWAVLDDMTMTFDGTQAFFRNEATSGTFWFQSRDSEDTRNTMIYASPNSTVRLYYDGNSRFETATVGDGGVIIRSDDNKVMDMYWSGSVFYIDTAVISATTMIRVVLYYDGTKVVDTFVGASAGNLYVWCTDQSSYTRLSQDGVTATWYNHYSDGPSVISGKEGYMMILDTNNGIKCYDENKITFEIMNGALRGWDAATGSSAYYELQFDGTDILLWNWVDSGKIHLQADNAASAKTTMAVFDPDGPVTLNYAGTTVAQTTASGISVPGGGITFPSTQVPSSDVNTLDDYEEGTWTPVVYDADTAGNAASSTTPLGTYTKIGRQVAVHCHLTDIDTSGLTAGNQLHIGGLPFARQTSVAVTYYAAVMVGNVVFTDSITASFVSTKSRVVLTDITSGASQAAVIVSDLTSGSADIRFSMIYEA